ncbi:hypothetical protein MKX72_20120 [Priestia sp. FSL R5-0597]|uniref:hypothetical protein n=1 Tax=Priestia sp. FSL R5-0597 TaxID=2921580 RepID=UPI0030F69DB8
MRKPTYDPKGFVSRLQSLAKYSVLFAEHQNEAFETSMKNSTKRLVEAYQEQNEYIEYLEKKLETPKQQYHLYEVTNGYQGYVPVSVEVMAENEERALKLASIAFIIHSGKRVRELGKQFGYDPDFWLDLKARLITENAGTHECTFEVKH